MLGNFKAFAKVEQSRLEEQVRCKEILCEISVKGKACEILKFFSIRCYIDLICLWCCEHVKCILVFNKKVLLLLSLLAKELTFDEGNVLVVFKVYGILKR